LPQEELTVKPNMTSFIGFPREKNKKNWGPLALWSKTQVDGLTLHSIPTQDFDAAIENKAVFQSRIWRFLIAIARQST